MSDWDASSGDEAAAPAAPAVAAPKVIKKSKYADEDASDDDIKDDWDASDDEEELAKKAAAAKPAGPAPPVRAKGITKQKIAEKEAAEREAAEARAARAQEDNDPLLRKQRERDAILKSDLDNATSLFGGASVQDEDPFSQRCSTAGDFDKLAETISERLIAKHGSHPLYAKFVEALVRGVCGPLKDSETRKAASGLTTLANEKQKAAKEATSKKKKPGKPALGATKSLGAGRADVGAYDEILDDSGDYDDFM